MAYKIRHTCLFTVTMCVLLALLNPDISILSGGQNAAAKGTVEIFIRVKHSSLKKGGDITGFFRERAIAELNERYNCSNIVPIEIPGRKSLFKGELKGREELEGIFLLQFDTEVEIQQVLDAYRENPDIEYVQKNHVYKVSQQTGADPKFDEQWYFRTIHIEDAWEITRGNPEILLAIIDTGIDYNHEDLKKNIWINPGEDINNNGEVDTEDFNGIDDDQNGYIDDIHGWDFTDAPYLADRGDYLKRDNDPFDEMGHGTSVAGLAAAVRNNGIGISGAAPECKLLNLRAGTSRGILQEDDVAAAVLYAVSMGARVINMSFGDVVYSRVLRDVIHFAYQNEVVIVASKGNKKTDRPHYPSDFSETISVGATNDNDELASFSNFGPAMDVVAPGSNLITTKRYNQYGDFSGTSASTPLVTGAVGLLLSYQPSLKPEEVRTILKKSSADLGDEGTDSQFGSGRLDAGAAVKISHAAYAHIHETGTNPHDPLRVAIIGTAGGREFMQYSLYYKEYPDYAEWKEIQTDIARQIINDTLAVWDTNLLQEGEYIIRLVVAAISGESFEARARFSKDLSAPDVTRFSYKEILRGTERLLLVELDTDEDTAARVKWNYEGDTNFKRTSESFMTAKRHKILIPLRSFSNAVEFTVEVYNEKGIPARLSTASGVFRFEPTSYEPPVWNMALEKTSIPPLFLMPGLLNVNSQDFIAGTIYNDNWAFGNIGIYNIQQEVKQLDIQGIPRDAGDFDGDGLMELLIGVGQKSFILEQPENSDDPFSLMQVWESASEYWAARAINIEGDNSLPELFFRHENDYVIYKNVADNKYEQFALLPNFTEGDNSFGIPHIESGDFDGDGKIEFLIGDGDGDIYIYEYEGGTAFHPAWHTRLDQIDAADFLAVGDADGDGVPEFLAGCHSDPSFAQEVNVEAKHWTFSLFRNAGDNLFEEVQKWNFVPFHSLQYFDSGCGAGDIDGDGRDEFVLSLYPNLYIIGYDSNTDRYKILWAVGPDVKNSVNMGYTTDIQPARSSRFVVLPSNSLLYNSEEGVYHLKKRTTSPNVSLTPFNVTARVIGPAKVYISWDYPHQTNINIKRKDPDAEHYMNIGITNKGFYVDSAVVSGRSYSYLISPENTGIESLQVTVQPHALPQLISAEFSHPNFLLLRFSAEMEKRIIDKHSYFFTPEDLEVTSAAFSHGYSGVLLTLNPETVSAAAYAVTVDSGLHDVRCAVIDPLYNSKTFEIPEAESEFYIVSARSSAPGQITLSFNVPLEKSSAENVSNYVLDPVGIINRAQVDEEDGAQVILTLLHGQQLKIGEYTLSVRNLKNKQGQTIDSFYGNAISFYLDEPAADENIYVYPNPYVASGGEEYVTFANIIPQTVIYIANQSGQVIRTIRSNTGDSKLKWQLDDKNGKRIASGIYIYYVKKGGKRIKGKLAVIR